MTTKHHQIVIIGAGTAGITVAARLKNTHRHFDVALIDPAEVHYYQPAFTLVAADTFDFKKTARPMASLIPAGVTWIKQAVTSIDPDQNQVTTSADDQITYDYLVVCPGIQIDLHGTPGLAEAFRKNQVCSIYVDPVKTLGHLQNFKGGTALFTTPHTPIKCGGAPQKIMYLAEDFWRKEGVTDKKIVFATPGTIIFGTPEFAKTLMQVVDRKKIHLRFFHKLNRVDGDKKLAYYTITAHANEPDKLYHNSLDINESFTSATEVVIPWDFMHVPPPQSAPDFIKNSKLAYADGPNQGWLNVNINTLQHNVYPNVFGLGDSAALPTAKTGAAIRKQAPIVVENMLKVMKNDAELKQYYGYSSCPLVTGYGKMVLAEFKYDNIRDSDPMISKFVDTTKENYSMWLLKKYGLPFMYWNLMLKGRA